MASARPINISISERKCRCGAWLRHIGFIPPRRSKGNGLIPRKKCDFVAWLRREKMPRAAPRRKRERGRMVEDSSVILSYVYQQHFLLFTNIPMVSPVFFFIIIIPPVHVPLYLLFILLHYLIVILLVCSSLFFIFFFFFLLIRSCLFCPDEWSCWRRTWWRETSVVQFAQKKTTTSACPANPLRFAFFPFPLNVVIILSPFFHSN